MNPDETGLTLKIKIVRLPFLDADAFESLSAHLRAWPVELSRGGAGEESVVVVTPTDRWTDLQVSQVRSAIEAWSAERSGTTRRLVVQSVTDRPPPTPRGRTSGRSARRTTAPTWLRTCCAFARTTTSCSTPARSAWPMT